VTELAEPVAEALEQVIAEVVGPQAVRVDTEAAFPADGLAALGAAGFLGLTTSADVGGGGAGPGAAAAVIESLAQACGSTAMVTLMHYAAVAVIDAHGPEPLRREIAAGRHLSTLAFSETGSRSHFWASASTAAEVEGGVRLDGHKSWVTAAAEADTFVFSSRPLSAEGPLSLWLVPRTSAGLSQPGGFDGLGLRGNGSTPVDADDVVVGADARLGGDGAGLDVALATALPWFLLLSAAFSVGLMEAVTAETGRHLTTTRLEHLDQTLIRQVLPRVDYARMRVTTDTIRALLDDALAAVESGRPDATLRVLESKAAAAEAAIDVTERAMKVCGGAAFRKELGIERAFRDARASRVMAPTTDALFDFIGRALGGLPLLEG
jgi:alkylation response protein AidB-like acyl-CoA dehydrogenase